MQSTHSHNLWLDVSFLEESLLLFLFLSFQREIWSFASRPASCSPSPLSFPFVSLSPLSSSAPVACSASPLLIRCRWSPHDSPEPCARDEACCDVPAKSSLPLPSPRHRPPLDSRLLLRLSRERREARRGKAHDCDCDRRTAATACDAHNNGRGTRTRPSSPPLASSKLSVVKKPPPGLLSLQTPDANTRPSALTHTHTALVGGENRKSVRPFRGYSRDCLLGCDCKRPGNRSHSARPASTLPSPLVWWTE